MKLVQITLHIQPDLIGVDTPGITIDLRSPLPVRQITGIEPDLADQFVVQAQRALISLVDPFEDDEWSDDIAF